MNLRTFLCCCIAVGLAVGAVRCKADDCYEWAYQVARLKDAKPELIAVWRVTDNRKELRTILKAQNWLAQGMTVEQAWKECER